MKTYIPNWLTRDAFSCLSSDRSSSSFLTRASSSSTRFCNSPPGPGCERGGVFGEKKGEEGEGRREGGREGGKGRKEGREVGGRGGREGGGRREGRRERGGREAGREGGRGGREGGRGERAEEGKSELK